MHPDLVPDSPPGRLSGPGRGPLVLVTGPARSGKSRFAASLAGDPPGPVTVLATGVATDPEMARRIAAHRAERPASWRTVEEPRAAREALERVGGEPGTVLLECLGFLLANWLEDASRERPGSPESPDREGRADEERRDILARVEALAIAARDCPARVIVVSNEVGWGLVPPYPAGRRFRDLLGSANQILAAHADQVWLVVAGLALELKASGLGVPAGGVPVPRGSRDGAVEAGTADGAPRGGGGP